MANDLTDALKKLLDQGANPNFLSNEDPGEKRTLLRLSIDEALQTEDWSRVDLLLTYKATDPSIRYEKTGENALDCAIQAQHLDLCRKIIHHKQEIVDDQHPKTKVSALHNAVYKDDLKIVMLLLLHGANVNVTDRFGATPLFFAQSVAMVDLLLAHDADICHLNSKGQSAIHVASLHGDRDLLRRYLQEIPELLDLQDDNGRTPLHLCVGKGYSGCASTLLDYGADMNIKTRSGRDAMDFADHQGQDDAAYYLYMRYTSSNKAAWSDRLKNPPFLFTCAIVGVFGLINRQLLYEVFLDIVDPIAIPGTMVPPKPTPGPMMGGYPGLNSGRY